MNPETEDLPADALRVAEVALLLHKSVPAVWDNLNKVPDFPQPTRVPGKRLTYWLRSDVEAFIAAQVDKAWREGKNAHPAVLDPETLDAARRAVYSLWMLGVPPEAVPGRGEDTSDAGNEHLHDFTYGLVNNLWNNRPAAPVNARGYPDVRAAQYLRTLEYCWRVMNNRTNPADNGWFDNRAGFVRGIWYPLGSPSGRKPWQEAQT